MSASVEARASASRSEYTRTRAAEASEALNSPLQGTILSVSVRKGSKVAEGDLICVIEAMKMENEIAAHRSGKVTALNVAEGAAVGSGDVLAVIE